MYAGVKMTGQFIWDTLTEGFKDTVIRVVKDSTSSVLYNGSSWVGSKTIENGQWIAASAGTFLAQIPDYLHNSFHASSDDNTCQDLYFRKIMYVSDSITGKAAKLNKSVLNYLAPNAEKAQFSFSEVVGPSFLLFLSAGYAAGHGLEALKQIKQLITLNKERPEYSVKDGAYVSDHYKDSYRSITSKALISSVCSIALGAVAYLTGVGIHNRLNEAKVDSSVQLGAAALATAAFTLSYIKHWIFKKPLTQTEIDAIEQDKQAKHNALAQQTSAVGTRNKYSFILPPSDGTVIEIEGGSQSRVTISSKGKPTYSFIPSPSYGSSSPNFGSSPSYSPFSQSPISSSPISASSYKADSYQSTLGRPRKGYFESLFPSVKPAQQQSEGISAA